LADATVAGEGPWYGRHCATEPKSTPKKWIQTIAAQRKKPR